MAFGEANRSPAGRISWGFYGSARADHLIDLTSDQLLSPRAAVKLTVVGGEPEQLRVLAAEGMAQSNVRLNATDASERCPDLQCRRGPLQDCRRHGGRKDLPVQMHCAVARLGGDN